MDEYASAIEKMRVFRRAHYRLGALKIHHNPARDMMSSKIQRADKKVMLWKTNHQNRRTSSEQVDNNNLVSIGPQRLLCNGILVHSASLNKSKLLRRHERHNKFPRKTIPGFYL